MPGLDYASIMSAGQNLVPDLRAQLLQDEQQRLMQAQRVVAVQNARDTQLRTAQFRNAVAEAAHSSDPRAIGRLMIQFPEFADQLKQGMASLSDADKARNITQMGTVFARANVGDFKGAAGVLRARIAADKAAGQDTSEDEQIAAALEGDDANARKAALATIGIHLAGAAGPDKFAETYGKLNPDEKLSPVMREYNDRVARFGKEAADKWLAVQDTKLIPVQAGGSIYNAADIVPSVPEPTKSGFTAGPQVDPLTGLPVHPATVMTATQPKGGDPVSAPPVGLMDPLRGRGHSPVAGGQFGASRDYGAHRATDYPAPIGTPVFSAGGAGTVRVGQSGKGGNIVTIDHGNGMVTRYMHLGQVNVQNGQRVGPDDVIGTVGTTGRATGPNLHYEAIWKGSKIDPGHFGQGAPPRIRSKQQFDRLPRGAEYIAPDGTHRRKA